MTRVARVIGDGDVAVIEGELAEAHAVQADLVEVPLLARPCDGREDDLRAIERDVGLLDVVERGTSGEVGHAAVGSPDQQPTARRPFPARNVHRRADVDVVQRLQPVAGDEDDGHVGQGGIGRQGGVARIGRCVC